MQYALRPGKQPQRAFVPVQAIIILLPSLTAVATYLSQTCTVFRLTRLSAFRRRQSSAKSLMAVAARMMATGIMPMYLLTACSCGIQFRPKLAYITFALKEAQ